MYMHTMTGSNSQFLCKNLAKIREVQSSFQDFFLVPYQKSQHHVGILQELARSIE